MLSFSVARTQTSSDASAIVREIRSSLQGMPLWGSGLSQKFLHALTPRAFGAHKEREVLAVGGAHRQHLPLPYGSLASEPSVWKDNVWEALLWGWLGVHQARLRPISSTTSSGIPNSL